MILVFLALIPVWVVVARQSPQIKEVLRSGWQPVIVAMSISRYDLKHLFNYFLWLFINNSHVVLIPSLCLWFPVLEALSWTRQWVTPTLRAWLSSRLSSTVSWWPPQRVISLISFLLTYPEWQVINTPIIKMKPSLQYVMNTDRDVVTVTNVHYSGVKAV